jgi:hypothetical protein
MWGIDHYEVELETSKPEEIKPKLYAKCPFTLSLGDPPVSRTFTLKDVTCL